MIDLNKYLIAKGDPIKVKSIIKNKFKLGFIEIELDNKRYILVPDVYYNNVIETTSITFTKDEISRISIIEGPRPSYFQTKES